MFIRNVKEHMKQNYHDVFMKNCMIKQHDNKLSFREVVYKIIDENWNLDQFRLVFSKIERCDGQ